MSEPPPGPLCPQQGLQGPFCSGVLALDVSLGPALGSLPSEHWSRPPSLTCLSVFGVLSAQHVCSPGQAPGAEQGGLLLMLPGGGARNPVSAKFNQI